MPQKRKNNQGKLLSCYRPQYKLNGFVDLAFRSGGFRVQGLGALGFVVASIAG